MQLDHVTIGTHNRSVTEAFFPKLFEFEEKPEEKKIAHILYRWLFCDDRPFVHLFACADDGNDRSVEAIVHIANRLGNDRRFRTKMDPLYYPLFADDSRGDRGTPHFFPCARRFAARGLVPGTAARKEFAKAPWQAGIAVTVASSFSILVSLSMNRPKAITSAADQAPVATFSRHLLTARAPRKPLHEPPTSAFKDEKGRGRERIALLGSDDSRVDSAETGASKSPAATFDGNNALNKTAFVDRSPPAADKHRNSHIIGASGADTRQAHRSSAAVPSGVFSTRTHCPWRSNRCQLDYLSHQATGAFNESCRPYPLLTHR